MWLIAKKSVKASMQHCQQSSFRSSSLLKALLIIVQCKKSNVDCESNETSSDLTSQVSKVSVILNCETSTCG